MVDKIFENGVIQLKNNSFIKILKVVPINYNLKSNLEKEAILKSYKEFLKSINFNFQILIQSCKADLKPHMTKIESLACNKSENMKILSKEYLKYINKINLNQKLSSKNFYIIISSNLEKKEIYQEKSEIIKNELQERYFKIKESLQRIGNQVIEENSKINIKNLLNIFFSNTKNY